jgi:hypothetical protein
VAVTNKRRFGRTSLNCKQKSRPIFTQIGFALTCLLIASASAFAQERTNRAMEKWRPKDGLYAAPGARFNDRCIDRTEVFVELTDKSIGGDEYDCKISKLTETGPGAVRLEAACTDVNREMPSPETPIREVIVLKKIDEETIFYRGTTNGKFKKAGARYSYCPEDVQRMHIEAKKKSD